MRKILLILSIILTFCIPAMALSLDEIKEIYDNKYYSPTNYAHTIEFEDIEPLMRLYNDAFTSVNSQASGVLLYNAQNLYVSIVKMEENLNTLELSYLSNTNNQILLKTKYDLGMITYLKYMEEVVNTKKTSISNESLILSIKSLKQNLNVLLGYDKDAILNLKSLPILVSEDFEKSGSSKDFKLAVENNHTYDNLPNDQITSKVSDKFDALVNELSLNIKTLENNNQGLTNANISANILDAQLNLGMLSKLQYQQAKLVNTNTATTYLAVQYDLYNLKIKYDLIVRGVII